MTADYQIRASLTDLCRYAEGPRDRQLLLGDAFHLIQKDADWSYGHAEKDGYQGYVKTATLEAAIPKSHWVSTLSSHAYAAPDLKSTDQISLPFGSQVTVTAQSGAFYETTQGFIPYQHLHPIGIFFTNPIQVAMMFLGTPYLWGGNSASGIDCSGLVQAACLACGNDCPGDTGPQQEFFPAFEGAWAKGQLLFWPGHVALTISTDELIHANAHAMSVRVEGIKTTIERISNAGDGHIIHRTQL
ncbi:MAG: NlpC/P60 family protein [Planktomarina sp.]|nr:NlpC/P60 family protein [Planktomarina sp.]MDT2056332.1 NlpC/P60 family protein [Planktomarina sp.]MDT2071869.1 NlpC/P60 family protein [Planktomarina sp.]MDT2076643.1 NlpC/P60 family protein [Planktomarina sp.]|tara:strand:+ start:25421 stop:26152 length:732 start_codon:yes stop_codon:yes gene_type:complete